MMLALAGIERTVAEQQFSRIRRSKLCRGVAYGDGGEEFVIARNPDPGSTLPYLVRIPAGQRPVILKVKDTWPRTNKIYCHPSTDWPRNPEIVERTPVRSCIRRGAAIDLVLERGIGIHRFSNSTAFGHRSSLKE